jgi:membrane fusion protein, multidrug efflux system
MTLGSLPSRPGRRRIELFQYRLHAIFAVVLIAAIGCSSNTSSAAKAKAPAKDGAPVVVATVAQKSVAKRVKAIGNVEPYSTVAVKSRVDGQIMAVHFKEGQNVTEGQLLFEIDPRPFRAQLMQSEATLMKDKAQYENALAQERRYQDLLQKNFVSKEFYSQIRTNLDSAAAGVRADEAAVENARVQLDYCTIRSPINGRTGKIMIQSGNLVKANDTASLVVINQVVPIYVAFSVPEQQLQAIRAYMAKGPLRVDATAQDAASPRASGDLTFIDNTVDAATGTIKLKATFRNADGSLWPGEFVTATVTLYEQGDAIVVPSSAVQTGPNGRYVFVVKPDMTVEMRDIVVDRTEGAETVVAKGLAPGLQVVTDGQLRLTPGARVNVDSRSAAS